MSSGGKGSAQPRRPGAPDRPRVVILGGGYGGIYTALGLERAARAGKIDLSLISRDNFFLFQPMLSEVVSGKIEPPHIVNPIRRLCRHTNFYQAEVESIDPENRQVVVSYLDHADYTYIPYDHLVIAVGSSMDLPRLPGVSEHSFPFKTLGDALSLRNHLIRVLESAEVEEDPQQKPGPAYLRDSRGRLHRSRGGRGDQRLRTGSGQELPPRRPPGGQSHPPGWKKDPARADGAASGVQPPTAGEAGDRDPAQLSHKRGYRGERDLKRRHNPPHPDRGGRHRRLFQPSAGQPAHCPGLQGTAGGGRKPFRPGPLGDVGVRRLRRGPRPKQGGTCPPTAQYAMREAKHLARNILASIKGGPLRPFSYTSRGSFVPLGKFSAAAELMGLKVSGFPAWWLYRSYYLLQLPRLERKIKVLIDWTLALLFRRDIVQHDISRSERFSRSHYEEGQIVFHQGELGRSFYIILSGDVEVFLEQQAGETHVAKLGPGEYFGEMSLLRGVRRNASIRALTSVDLLTISGSDFTALAGSSAHFGQILAGC